MNCKNCGATLEEGIKICPTCGTDNEIKVEEVVTQPEVQPEVQEELQPVIQSEIQPEEQPAPQPEKKKEGKAVASMVIGIISLFVWPLGITIILTLIGLILGITHKGKSGKKIAGIILNTLCMLLEIGVIVAVVFFINTMVTKPEKIIGMLGGEEVQEYLEDTNIKSLFNINSDWDEYSNLRKGSLGKKLDINGEYRILSDKENYVVFKNNEYYKYDSLNNKEDNYEYGKVTIEKGTDGLSKFGISSSELEQFSNMHIANISVDNIYILTCAPSKIVVDGEVNEIEDEERLELWILIDHSKEGIQAVNVDTDTQELVSYVKTKD